MGIGIQIIFGFIALCIALYYSGRSKSLLQSIDKAVFGSYGCLPAPAIEQLTLTYFPIRGRAEGIRMILEDNSVLYSELNFNSDEWPEIKKKGIEIGTFTFGQVPAITTESGFSLVQSLAIVHYIGRSLGLDCNCEYYHICEVIALGTEDLRSKYSKVLYDPKFSIEKRNVYISDVLPTWLAHFERLAPEIRQESNDSFFIGGRLTWIDYIMFELIDSNIEFSKNTKPYLKDITVVEQDILENFPRLNNFYQTFYLHPQLKKYMVSKNRRPFKLPYLPSVMETKTF